MERKMKAILEQSQSGRLQLVTDTLTDNSQVYNIVVNNVAEIACASESDAIKLFALLDNTAYDILPRLANAYPRPTF